MLKLLKSLFKTSLVDLDLTQANEGFLESLKTVTEQPIPVVGDYRIIEDGNGLFSVQQYTDSRNGNYWSNYSWAGANKYTDLAFARKKLDEAKAREERHNLSNKVKKVYYE